VLESARRREIGFSYHGTDMKDNAGNCLRGS
jgi:hypothetical protein